MRGTAIEPGHRDAERKPANIENVRLATRLRQAQRMEAVNQLARRMAHDLNNIFTTILGNAEMSISDLQRELPPGDRLLRRLRKIEQATHRASSLTWQLQMFNGRNAGEPTVLDVNQTLRDVEKRLRLLTSDNIALGIVRDPNLRHIRADAAQVEQLIVSLYINARNAMPGGGQITLRTANVTLDTTYASTHPEASVGPHVLLVVTDTGSRTEAETIERIFDPLLSKKPPGHRFTLGLAPVYGIVEQTGGHVVVENEQQHRTTVRVYLPAMETPVTEPQELGSADAAEPAAETILVCDDDEAILDLLGQSLRSAGFTVLTAVGPEEALDISREHPGPIHLLVSDVIMGAMGGIQLAERLGASRPTLRMLFVSGYMSDVIDRHDKLGKDVEFLEKPFTRDTLLCAVRDVLGRQKASDVRPHPSTAR